MSISVDRDRRQHRNPQLREHFRGRAERLVRIVEGEYYSQAHRRCQKASHQTENPGRPGRQAGDRRVLSNRHIQNACAVEGVGNPSLFLLLRVQHVIGFVRLGGAHQVALHDSLLVQLARLRHVNVHDCLKRGLPGLKAAQVCLRLGQFRTNPCVRRILIGDLFTNR